jgi:hypothetical protein
MASTDANMDRNKRANLSKNLVDEENSTAKETNWITDDIPVTIFRASYGSSGTTMHYLSNNVEELTGCSKMDFLDNKITLDDVILPEDIQDYYKVKQKAIKNQIADGPPALKGRVCKGRPPISRVVRNHLDLAVQISLIYWIETFSLFFPGNR